MSTWWKHSLYIRQGLQLFFIEPFQVSANCSKVTFTLIVFMMDAPHLSLPDRGQKAQVEAPGG